MDDPLLVDPFPWETMVFSMVFPCIWDSKQQRFSDYGQVVVVAIPQFYQLTLPTQAIEAIDLDDLR